MKIEYETPDFGSRKNEVSQRGALMLCAPGAMGLLLLSVEGALHAVLPAGVLKFLGMIFWPLVLLAVITAWLSLHRYALMPCKPWFVIVNLAINGFGLTLLLLIIAGEFLR